MLEIVQIEAFYVLDNYLYIIHGDGFTATVDPAVPEPIIEACEARGWTLTHILSTHHHGDHTGANLALKEKYGCVIVGNGADAARIPGIDVQVSEGDTVTLGDATATVMDVSGHTVGHIAYHFADDNALFIGDTVFSLGCGRMFEGTPEMYQGSLEKVKALPASTKLYCAHEYTASNGAFALSVEPDNAALIARMEEVGLLRAANQPTVPSTLASELACNPFLRTHSAEIRTNLGLIEASNTAVFAELRARKDNF